MPTRSATRATSPLYAAAAAQSLGAVIAVTAIHIVYPKLFAAPVVVAALQGLCAALVSYKLDSPKWWLPIHLGFLPTVLVASRVGIAPIWYLGGFVLLLLIFWRTDRSRVPLYLSSKAATMALVALLPDHPCHIVDLGCGHGGLLRRLAEARLDCQFYGIEHAPLPWLWAWLASIPQENVLIRYGDFWQSRLALFDVVYVFLSPVPMARLLTKARAEMPAGTLLVSNSFAASDHEPEAIIEVTDRRASRLYCYRMPGQTPDDPAGSPTEA
jgi:hypothetical protein